MQNKSKTTEGFVIEWHTTGHNNISGQGNKKESVHVISFFKRALLSGIKVYLGEVGAGLV